MGDFKNVYQLLLCIKNMPKQRIKMAIIAHDSVGQKSGPGSAERFSCSCS